MIRNRLRLEEYLEGIRSCDLRVLPKALTLLESRHPEDQALSAQLLAALGTTGQSSIRIGITGIPGAGKSSLLNTWLPMLAAQARVAVLSIDPSSPVSGGSLMGDKTRMQNILDHPSVFVRPSPSQGISGGAHASSYDAIRVLEAAGYEYIFVETVGVGQTETEVRYLCDVVLYLWIHGTGDELQLLKKGITEIADIVLLHKADTMSLDEQKHRAHQISAFLQLPCFSSSSIDKNMASEAWNNILAWINEKQKLDLFAKKRLENQTLLFRECLLKEVHMEFLGSDLWKTRFEEFLKIHAALSPPQAARKFWEEVVKKTFFGA